MLVRVHVSAQPVCIYRHAVYEVKACFVRKALLTQDSEYKQRQPQVSAALSSV